MTQFPQNHPSMITAKPQPDIYTVLLVVAVLVLLATLAAAIWNLMTVYGMKFLDVFKPLSEHIGR